MKLLPSSHHRTIFVKNPLTTVLVNPLVNSLSSSWCSGDTWHSWPLLLAALSPLGFQTSHSPGFLSDSLACPSWSPLLILTHSLTSKYCRVPVLLSNYTDLISNSFRSWASHRSWRLLNSYHQSALPSIIRPICLPDTWTFISNKHHKPVISKNECIILSPQFSPPKSFCLLMTKILESSWSLLIFSSCIDVRNSNHSSPSPMLVPWSEAACFPAWMLIEIC